MIEHRREVFSRTVVLMLMCAFLGVLRASSAVVDTSLPKESSWAWIYTAALFDQWQSTTGRATVTVEGTKFTAKLFDADHPTLVLFTLSGTVKGDQVRVRVVSEHSDSSPADYSGKMVTRFFTGFANYAGVQTIVLSDQSQHQLGFTRALRP